jgi:histidinol dehydrogenase
MSAITLLPEVAPEALLAERRRRGLELPDVSSVLEAVRREGDAAVRRFTRQWDGVDLEGRALAVTPEAIEAAWESVGPTFQADLERVWARLRRFHEEAVTVRGGDVASAGVVARLHVAPVRRVGLYVPAGRAPLFSSVLMLAAPARAAGVEEIALVSPPRLDGEVDRHVLAAARVAGITEVYRVGGAQAIAALAFGTAEIPAVELIAGPGNAYVTAAKKAVFGTVAIDLLAGPSEVLIVADGTADPELVALDLMAQAEHDPEAVVALLALDPQVPGAVRAHLTAHAPASGALAASLGAARAAVVPDRATALAVVRAFAPEHLELHVADPASWLPDIAGAGAVFLGAAAPTALGDYVAGPDHVLPTGGTAVFASALSKLNFLRTYTSVAVAEVDRELFALAERLARAEGLPFHAESLARRLPG